MVRRCWVNFQCRGVLLIWITVGQGPTALAVGTDGGCLDIFTPVYHFSFLSPSLWETARYRLKYCLKGPLRSKQPTSLYPYQMLSFYKIKSFTWALRNTDHEVSFPKCPGIWLYFINQGQLFQINYINTG